MAVLFLCPTGTSMAQQIRTAARDSQGTTVPGPIGHHFNEVGALLESARLKVAGTLVIQGGRIKRLEAGKCRVTGTLKCEKQAITERTSRDFSWSDGISFGEGVSIAAVT
jgi:hypothetical protein